MTDLSQFDTAIPSIDQMTGLLAIDDVFGTQPVRCPKDHRASFVYDVLVTHKYQTQNRRNQGVIRDYS